MSITSTIKNFAGTSNIKLNEAFRDYMKHWQAKNEKGKENLEYQKYSIKDGREIELTLDTKEKNLNFALKQEIFKKAGVGNVADFSLDQWAGHPVLKWATFAVVSQLIDMILPETLDQSIGLYSEIKTIGWGDSASFDIKPRDLFTVSKSGRGNRLAEMQRQYTGQVNILPEERQITVGVSLYRVLAGEDSLADFVMKAIRSLESQLTVDVYDVFATAMNAIDNTAGTGLRVAGYTQAEFTRLSQTVKAWNNNASPLAIGTQLALANILPADANYRYDIASDFVKLGYIRNFQQTDIMMLPQVANWNTPFDLRLADNRVWIISPSTDKIVKVVLEGSTLSYTDNPYQNANLLQNATLVKSYGVGIATASVGATIELP